MADTINSLGNWLMRYELKSEVGSFSRKLTYNYVDTQLVLVLYMSVSIFCYIVLTLHYILEANILFTTLIFQLQTTSDSSDASEPNECMFKLTSFTDNRLSTFSHMLWMAYVCDDALYNQLLFKLSRQIQLCSFINKGNTARTAILLGQTTIRYSPWIIRSLSLSVTV